jgi:hypothetical protein
MWPNNDPEMMQILSDHPLPIPDSFTKLPIQKIGVVVNVSTEVFEQAEKDRLDFLFYMTHREEIKAQNAAFATYWPNHPSFDNPNIVRGYN